MKISSNYNRTIIGCFLGIFNQAVVTNITPILFVPFMLMYNLDLFQLGLLIGINFAAQMLADIILTKLIDKVPFRKLAISALSISVIGFVLFALVPAIMPQNIYIGLVIATIVCAFSSGMLEVTLSPIIDNMPESAKGSGGIMSFMHSFYAWGQVICIIVTSLFLLFFVEYWYVIVAFWAIVPMLTIAVFSNAPLDKKSVEMDKKSILKVLLNPFMILALFAILLGGASEVIINQFVSTFSQLSLGFDKLTSDLVGMCLFAVMLGLGRVMYGLMGRRLNLHIVLIVCSLATFVLYLVVALVPIPVVALVACILIGFSSSLLWPGTLLITSNRFPRAGAWTFAILAISGDIGAGLMPAISGAIANNTNLNFAILIMAAVPLVAFVTHSVLLNLSNVHKARELGLLQGELLSNE